MGEDSKIQWTHHTFNPWVGCMKVSAGCTNCYAENSHFVNIERSRGRELWGANGVRHIISEARWREVLKWNDVARAAGERHRVFCASLADVFEERPDLEEPRLRLLKLIMRTPSLDWLLLTKRPANIERMIARPWFSGGNDSEFHTWLGKWVHGRPPPNVWLGVTGEKNEELVMRAAILERIPAAVRFISAEPLLEDVSDALSEILGVVKRGGAWERVVFGNIDWVIFGGESGSKARPCAIDWLRNGVDICRAAHIAPFVKQLGANATLANLPLQITSKKGGDLDDIPEDLRIREFPTPRKVA